MNAVRDAASMPAEISSLSGGARPFRWSPDAVCRLDQEAEWALTSNPTGAAEVAGVLLGKIGATIEITDCRPVFLMHPRDHAYALTGPGKREFERTTAAFQSIPPDGLSVIGFYRSHIGYGFDLTEEDRGLLRTCFRDTNQVALLIELTGDRSSRVRLFSGDQGQVVSQFYSAGDASGLPRWLELWQNLSPDGPPHTAGPEDTTEPEPEMESADATDPADTTPEVPPICDPVAIEQRLNRTPLLLLVAATILTVLVGYTIFNGLARLKQGTATSGPAAVKVQDNNSRDSELALRLQRHGDDLQLDWNRNAPVIAAATGGMLTIRERNGREKQVMLDGNLLRTGGVIYRPVYGDVSLRLVLFGQDGTKMGESVASYPPRTFPEQE
jgi:hypothetical protein